MASVTARLETNKADTLAGFHESVKDFAKEAKMVFDDSGVRLSGNDTAQITMVQYVLPAASLRGSDDGCGSYTCPPGGVCFCIDTKMVANCLHRVSSSDVISFSIDREAEPDRMIISCQNAANGKKSFWRVVTPDPPDHLVDSTAGLGRGGFDYNGSITISSALFHDMMSDLRTSDANNVRVCCDGKRLVLAANGKNIKSSNEIDVGQGPARFEYTANAKDHWPVCESYAMTFLEKVAKNKQISSQLHIYMRPNLPITFEYETDIGKISYMISPKDDDEWLENPSSRIMPQPSDTIQATTQRPRVSPATKPSYPSGKRRREGDDFEDEDSSSYNSVGTPENGNTKIRKIS